MTKKIPRRRSETIKKPRIVAGVFLFLAPLGYRVFQVLLGIIEIIKFRVTERDIQSFEEFFPGGKHKFIHNLSRNVDQRKNKS